MYPYTNYAYFMQPCLSRVQFASFDLTLVFFANLSCTLPFFSFAALDFAMALHDEGKPLCQLAASSGDV